MDKKDTDGRDLIVILKISEACPLACDYCYYFRNMVRPHKPRPISIGKDVVKQLCGRINEFNEKNKISKVSFSLHGGEPLAIGKDYFREICNIIIDNLKVPYFFLLQSNAVLIDKEWTEIFKKYKVKLGLSIDGPEEYQNVHRKLKNGEGSFAIVDKNARLCISEQVDLGVLMVADPNFAPQKIWDYLIDDVGIKSMDILLRDYTHDTLPSQEYAEEIRDYFVAWINIWFSRDDKSVKIRMFDNVVNVLLGKRSHLEFAFNKNSLNSNYPTVTVYTDGDISPTDELTSINDDLMDTGKNLANDSLEDVFSIKVFGELREAQQNIPKDCDGCCWKYACRGGGGILEKFSSKNRFSNKSVYCKVWSELFPIVTSKLLSHGYPKEQLLNILTGENNASA